EERECCRLRALRVQNGRQRDRSLSPRRLWGTAEVGDAHQTLLVCRLCHIGTFAGTLPLSGTLTIPLGATSKENHMRKYSALLAAAILVASSGVALAQSQTPSQ